MPPSILAFASREEPPSRRSGGPRPVLDARRLIVLREVARLGSFSAAAQALFITQPAVSRQIATLERELGRKVLVRTPRGLRLTEAGRLLVEHAEAIVARLAAAEGQLASLDRLEAGTLRLGASGAAAARVLARAMAALRARHPAVELSLQEVEDPAGPVRGGELDVALAFERPLGPGAGDGEAERLRLLDDRLLLALPDGHRLADRDALRLAELAEETWVRVQPDGPGVAFAACVAAGFQPRVRFDARGTRVACDLVRAGLGVAFVSALGLEAETNGLALRDLGAEAPVRTLVAVARPPESRPPAADALVGILLEQRDAWSREP